MSSNCVTSSGIPIKYEQQVHDFLTAILLPSEIADITIKAHAKRTELEPQGKTPADVHAKA